MKKINLALLYGGTSSERQVSISSANGVFEALNKEKYNISRYDTKNQIPDLIKDKDKIDIAFIILHGQYGEDGTVQGLLDLLNIPYQGSGVLASSVAINKVASKKMYEINNILTPEYLCMEASDSFSSKKDEILKLGLPLVIKPTQGGSSLGISIIKEENKIKDACDLAFRFDNQIILEKYVKGIELTSAVIGNKVLSYFPSVEIIPNDKYDFFDYEAKYQKNATTEITPARISADMEKKVGELGKKAHKALFCRGYSRTDMILDDKENLYVLETNTIPGMTPTSLFPLAAKAANISFSSLLDKLVGLALDVEK